MNNNTNQKTNQTMVNVGVNMNSNSPNPTVATISSNTTNSSNITSAQAVPTIPKKEKKSHKGIFIFLLLVIIVLMGIYIYMDYQKDLTNKCSPLVSSDKTLRTLDLESDIVKDLYSKVYTNIREDVANSELNDNMKLYLAYRQIPNSKIYDSNCNLFSNTAMNSYICEENTEFYPTAFKEDTLQLEIKKLFGSDVSIENNNIQLGNSCIGGYQYISERGEYVQGYCKEVSTTKYSAEKELISAFVQADTITLKEKVRYYSSETVPEFLKNGTYIYTFRLDNNYNYVYVSKTVE